MDKGRPVNRVGRWSWVQVNRNGHPSGRQNHQQRVNEAQTKRHLRHAGAGKTVRSGATPLGGGNKIEVVFESQAHPHPLSDDETDENSLRKYCIHKMVQRYIKIKAQSLMEGKNQAERMTVRVTSIQIDLDVFKTETVQASVCLSVDSLTDEARLKVALGQDWIKHNRKVLNLACWTNSARELHGSRFHEHR